jgi:hypothetical protein
MREGNAAKESARDVTAKDASSATRRASTERRKRMRAADTCGLTAAA